MLTGGLSRTDVGKREVIGGLSLEFYTRVGTRYGMHRFLHPVAWLYEPRVGESVLREMLEEAQVPVLFGQRLREKTGVIKSGTQITEIILESGRRLRGKVFADASYEGDLMAQAKVTYTLGRESTEQYGESLAGVRDRTPLHQFLVDVPAKDDKGNLLPEIEPGPPAKPGTADRRIQAYNFRIIATTNPNNRIAWPKPTGYDPKRYEAVDPRHPGDHQKGRSPAGVQRTQPDCANTESKGPTSTTVAVFPATTSARTTTIPMATTKRAPASGKSTSTISRASTISWPMIRAYPERCSRKSARGASPRTSSKTRATGRINSISAKHAVWWAKRC